MPAADSISNRLTRTKTIRDELYTIRLLTTEAGEEPLVRLIELLGPAFVDTLASEPVLRVIASAAKSDFELDAKLLAELSKPLAEAVRGVIARLRRDDLAYFAGVFKPLTKVGSGVKSVELAQVYDVHFAGQFGALREWLVWCLTENFADFFGGGGAIKSALAAVRAAAQESAPDA